MIYCKLDLRSINRTIESIALEKGRWEGELTQHTKNNEPIVVASRWALKRGENENPISILEIDNDISEAKEAERKVSEFYSTVSHELRTPLTSLKGVLACLMVEELVSFLSEPNIRWYGSWGS